MKKKSLFLALTPISMAVIPQLTTHFGKALIKVKKNVFNVRGLSKKDIEDYMEYLRIPKGAYEVGIGEVSKWPFSVKISNVMSEKDFYGGMSMKITMKEVLKKTSEKWKVTWKERDGSGVFSEAYKEFDSEVEAEKYSDKIVKELGVMGHVKKVSELDKKAGFIKTLILGSLKSLKVASALSFNFGLIKIVKVLEDWVKSNYK